MAPNDRALAKADALLKSELERSPSQRVFRAILRLGVGAETGATEGPAPSPSEFDDMSSWRRAVREQLKSRRGTQIEPVVDQLRALGLQPQGGELSGIVRVEGSADALRRALDLPGVERAIADSYVDVPSDAAVTAPDEGCFLVTLWAIHAGDADRLAYGVALPTHMEARAWRREEEAPTEHGGDAQLHRVSAVLDGAALDALRVNLREGKEVALGAVGTIASAAPLVPRPAVIAKAAGDSAHVSPAAFGAAWVRVESDWLLDKYALLDRIVAPGPRSRERARSVLGAFLVALARATGLALTNVDAGRLGNFEIERPLVAGITGGGLRVHVDARPVPSAGGGVDLVASGVVVWVDDALRSSGSLRVGCRLYNGGREPDRTIVTDVLNPLPADGVLRIASNEPIDAYEVSAWRDADGALVARESHMLLREIVMNISVTDRSRIDGGVAANPSDESHGVLAHWPEGDVLPARVRSARDSGVRMGGRNMDPWVATERSFLDVVGALLKPDESARLAPAPQPPGVEESVRSVRVERSWIPGTQLEVFPGWALVARWLVPVADSDEDRAAEALRRGLLVERDGEPSWHLAEGVQSEVLARVQSTIDSRSWTRELAETLAEWWARGGPTDALTFPEAAGPWLADLLVEDQRSIKLSEHGERLRGEGVPLEEMIPRWFEAVAHMHSVIGGPYLPRFAAATLLSLPNGHVELARAVERADAWPWLIQLVIDRNDLVLASFARELLRSSRPAEVAAGLGLLQQHNAFRPQTKLALDELLAAGRPLGEALLGALSLARWAPRSTATTVSDIAPIASSWPTEGLDPGWMQRVLAHLGQERRGSPLMDALALADRISAVSDASALRTWAWEHADMRYFTDSSDKDTRWPSEYINEFIALGRAWWPLHGNAAIPDALARLGRLDPLFEDPVLRRRDWRVWDRTITRWVGALLLLSCVVEGATETTRENAKRMLASPIATTLFSSTHSWLWDEYPDTIQVLFALASVVATWPDEVYDPRLLASVQAMATAAWTPRRWKLLALLGSRTLTAANVETVAALARDPVSFLAVEEMKRDAGSWATLLQSWSSQRARDVPPLAEPLGLFERELKQLLSAPSPLRDGPGLTP